jgi:hypothetical protein
MRFETWVALALLSFSGELEETVEPIVEVSSTMVEEELFLPKLNFHLEGFFAMEGTGGTEEVVGSLGIEELAFEFGAFDFDFVSTMGMGYMDTGSYGISRRVLAEILDVVREVLLISRASDCDATASVSNVWSCLKGGTEVSLRLVRAPRFRRLLFD